MLMGRCSEEISIHIITDAHTKLYLSLLGCFLWAFSVCIPATDLAPFDALMTVHTQTLLS